MRALWVSGIDGFCHRYQVLHRVAQLASAGGSSTVRSFTDPRLRDDAAAHDVVVLYRVPETAWIVAAIAAARARGAAVVGAIDDLVFLPDPALFPELAERPAAERDLWLEGLRRYRATLERCDVTIAPTRALVDELRAVGLQAELHRNAVGDPELALARAARARRGAYGAGVVIGYMSGTATHDRDLAGVAPALARVLRERADVVLRLVGPVAAGSELAVLSDRVERRPLVPWWQLADAIADCDVCIAPLEADRRFAAAKGEVKYLESAAVGVPLVATPSPAFRDAIVDRVNGRLAATAGDWHAALCELVASPAERARLGEAAYADVTRTDRAPERARELLALLRAAAAAARPRAAWSERAASLPRDREPARARAALEMDAFPAACEPGEPVAESPPLVAGHVLRQRIRIACDGLVRIDVHTVTYGLPVAGRLEAELSDERGRVLARAALPASEAPDRGWLAVDVADGPIASAGRCFDLSLRLAADDPRAGLSFGLARGGATSPAELDGQPLDGRLALRGFAEWSAALGSAASPVAAASPPERAAAVREGARDGGAREVGSPR
ncbi:MAG TPA: glycosyltransferase [Candidatus Binatia bacterium]|nr:glycosyltransferase [Candidatus Binatia bacterium]